MRSLDKKQPAEDNLSLEPWVLGGRVDLLDGGRGHVSQFACILCRCVLLSRLSRFVVLYSTHHTLTRLSRVSRDSVGSLVGLDNG